MLSKPWRRHHDWNSSSEHRACAAFLAATAPSCENRRQRSDSSSTSVGGVEIESTKPKATSIK
eukprot:2325456-Prymnesium_polylepis.1